VIVAFVPGCVPGTITVHIGHDYFLEVHFANRTLARLGVGFIALAFHGAGVLPGIGYFLVYGFLNGLGHCAFVSTVTGDQRTER
jgi:hypothetical protein